VLERTLSGLFAGFNISNVAQLRAGIAYLDGEARRKVGDPNVFRRERFNGGLYAAQLEYDTLDNVHFPNDGSYGLIESFFVRREMGFTDSYETLSGQVNTFRTWSKNTIGLALKYQTAFGTGDQIEVLNSLGGFLNLSAYPRSSITGKHVGLARLMAYRRIASPAVFAWEFPVYVGGAVEAGNAWEEREDIDDLQWAGTPFVGVETPLGPLYLAYSIGEGGEQQGYIYLGRSF
jgi:NTE family protein